MNFNLWREWKFFFIPDIELPLHSILLTSIKHFLANLHYITTQQQHDRKRTSLVAIFQEFTQITRLTCIHEFRSKIINWMLDNWARIIASIGIAVLYYIPCHTPPPRPLGTSDYMHNNTVLMHSETIVSFRDGGQTVLPTVHIQRFERVSAKLKIMFIFQIRLI